MMAMKKKPRQNFVFAIKSKSELSQIAVAIHSPAHAECLEHFFFVFAVALSLCVSMKLLVCNEKLIFFNDFLTLFQERARTSKLASAADGRRLNPWER